MHNLLEFLARHNHWFLFVILEVASFVMLFQYNSYQGSVWFSSANSVAGNMYEMNSDVTQFFGMVKNNEELTLRNFYLERQVHQLREKVAYLGGDTTSTMGSQMDMLNKYNLITAKVVANSVDKMENFITINKGKVDGVKEDMGVICGNGVVGVVYLTSAHYSVIIPVLNPRSNISCRIRNRGYFGNLVWDGKDSQIAYLEDVPRHAHFKKGDYVETSGYSSIYPPGVLVGKIICVFNSSDGLSYRVQVQLSTDFGRLRDVCVINDPGLAERVQILQAARDSLRQKGDH